MTRILPASSPLSLVASALSSNHTRGPVHMPQQYAWRPVPSWKADPVVWSLAMTSTVATIVRIRQQNGGHRDTRRRVMFKGTTPRPIATSTRVQLAGHLWKPRRFCVSAIFQGADPTFDLDLPLWRKLRARGKLRTRSGDGKEKARKSMTTDTATNGEPHL